MSDKKRLEPADHQCKEVREALKEIVDSGNWDLVQAGHWGSLRCGRPCNCKIPVSGTPRVPGRHARQLLQAAGRCPVEDGSGYMKPRAK